MYDLIDRGGKRWRPALCFFVAEAFGYDIDLIMEIAAFCEIVHNATLVIDDIEDDSQVRRDKKCVHLLYGIDIAINAGMFMCYAPFQYLL
jgi:geranylgeranyl pyrophosphate synthase